MLESYLNNLLARQIRRDRCELTPLPDNIRFVGFCSEQVNAQQVIFTLKQQLHGLETHSAGAC